MTKDSRFMDIWNKTILASLYGNQAPVSQTVSNLDSSSTQALKNPVSKKECKIHTHNHCQLNDMITISKFDEYNGIILNFS